MVRSVSRTPQDEWDFTLLFVETVMATGGVTIQQNLEVQRLMRQMVVGLLKYENAFQMKASSYEAKWEKVANDYSNFYARVKGADSGLGDALAIFTEKSASEEAAGAEPPVKAKRKPGAAAKTKAKPVPKAKRKPRVTTKTKAKPVPKAKARAAPKKRAPATIHELLTAPAVAAPRIRRKTKSA